MRIFRFEHQREFCNSVNRPDHGPVSGNCYSRANVPDFGYWGSCPEFPMQVHERCAVTQEQFPRWVSPDHRMRICNPYEEWHLVQYSVREDQENLYWRIDNDQIIFDPFYARRMGSVSVLSIYNPLDRMKVSA